MRILVFSLILGILILYSGFCSSAQERDQPTAPEKVAGWKDTYSAGIHSIGELFLHKGSLSDNGSIGVEVVDVVKPQAGAEGYAGMPKVVLRFYRPADKQIICEATFTEGGTSMGNGPPYPHCKPDVGLSAISVNAINTKENWVWFDLRK
jgi:hypothetical protein